MIHEGRMISFHLSAIQDYHHSTVVVYRTSHWTTDSGISTSSQAHKEISLPRNI